MLTRQVVASLGRNLSRFARIEEQLSSARRINRPSDDPIGTVRVLEYRHELRQISQWQAELNNGLRLELGRVRIAQGALDQIVFERSKTGSKQNRLENTSFPLLEQELNVTSLRSDYEDADILELFF
jgi:flagellar hook-associated protein 3 FlgL